MKRLVAAVAALSTLAGPTLALAQEHDHHEGGGRPPAGGQPHGGGAPQQAAPPRPAPQYHAPAGGSGYRPQGVAQPQGQPGGYRPQGAGQPQGQPGGYRPQGAYQLQGQPGGYRPQGGQPGGYRVGPGNNPGYRGGPRPGAIPFNWGGRSFYRYRAEPYRYPSGYGAWARHGWRRGEFLPSFFFLPNYYISDYWAYGLWEPDYGLQWIRVGADALLINLATGEVVDVVPGVYYW
jgi:Ni/Co efflux regulator RcnB